MNDTTVAPAAAPSAPPAPMTEVPVTTPPQSHPTPIGSQTPDKPVEQRPTSRREAIQQAYERAEKAKNAKPAEAKIGHNRPPEATPKEKPKEAKPEPINLRQPPPKDDANKPPRGEHGHFVRREDVQSAQPPAQTRANTAQTVQSAQSAQPVQSTYEQRQAWQHPLPRMTEHAKREWAATPESVRADVHRMNQEFSRAYQQYRGAHEAMQPLLPYHELARSQGTTLDRALSNYVQMEHKLRNDVVGGLDLIIDNLNLRDQDGNKLTLQDVAWHIVNQTPEQRQLLQSRNTVMAQTHQLQAQNQRIAQLENLARQMQYRQQFVQTRGGVDKFAKSHPRFDELGDLIEQEVKLGFSIDQAYQRADKLRPAHSASDAHTAAQTRTTTAQTRTSDRSISGAPGGSTNGTGTHRKPVGRREALANAVKRASNSL